MRQKPTVEGWIVAAGDAGVRLDKFLAAADRLGSRPRASIAIERGKVFVNDAEAGRKAGSLRLAAGDVVRIWIDRPGSARRRHALGESHDLHILFEDDAIVVLNKPAGLLAVPLPRKGDAPAAYRELARYLRARRVARPFVVHRIDRDTSGLVVFAKRADVQERLKEQFKRHEAERVYRAVVYGHPDPPEGTWRDYLVWDREALIQKETHPRDPRGTEAISQYRVVERLRGASLVEVRLVTGKRNQIRLQARLRGHTLVGEQRYVYGPELLRPIQFHRQALHAHQLSFRHPVDGRTMRFEAPIPADFAALLAQLRRI